MFRILSHKAEGHPHLNLSQREAAPFLRADFDGAPYVRHTLAWAICCKVTSAASHDFYLTNGYRVHKQAIYVIVHEAEPQPCGSALRRLSVPPLYIDEEGAWSVLNHST